MPQPQLNATDSSILDEPISLFQIEAETGKVWAW